MILRADVRQIPLVDESVQCVVTSPPYWGLRDYGVDGQLGLESTPEEYVAGVVQVFQEVWRVLKKSDLVAEARGRIHERYHDDFQVLADS